MPPRKKAKVSHLQEGPTANLRRSTRTNRKQANDVSANAPEVQPPAPTSVVKLRRGCLKEIPNFAIEIQLMIFGHLHPQDLFNLSRTAKIFHGFFLHRSNEALWDAALKNAEDLPEKPQWLSIPAFIHLLYSPHCHNCGCANIRKVEWRWFARYCSKCFSIVTCEPDDVFHQLSEVGCNLRAADVLDRVEIERTDATSRYRRSWTETWYLQRDVDRLIGQWSALPEHPDSTTRKAFYAQRSNDLQIRRKHAVRCAKWHDRLEKDRKDGLRDGRKDRFAAIVKKLVETGWKQDLDFLGPRGLERMSRLPVVRQSGKLTDKGWEKVQAALHTFLCETRDARLKKEREALIKDRFAELDKAILAHCVTIPRNATMDCHPVALDFALQAELEPVANAPSSETVTQESFAVIVPQLVARWEAEQRQSLQAYLRQFIATPVPQGVDILDLAIAIFYSPSFCSPKEVRRMRYPYLLTLPFFRWSDLTYGHYAYPARPGSHSGPCDTKQLQLKAVEVGIKWMRKIVVALGLDPDTATFADLEQCEGRLRCLQCAKTEGKKDYVYTWEAAFAHTAENNTTHSYSHNKYPRSVHHRWSLVKKAEMSKVKEREAVAHELTVDSECVWSCALCADWKGSGTNGKVREHLSSEHNITDADGAMDDGTIFWSPIHSRDLKKPAVQL